jgi:hypothetical protein
MRRTALRALIGVVCALSLGSVRAASPRRSPSSRPALRQAPRAPSWIVHSPDGRHRIELGAAGRVHLDGRPLSSAGKPLSAPVWRRDSRALAFLQRGEVGLQLVVVLLDVDPWRPLVWSLPSLAGSSCRHLFWIAPQRIGVGEKALVPRLVVSWTTTLV